VREMNCATRAVEGDGDSNDSSQVSDESSVDSETPLIQEDTRMPDIPEEPEDGDQDESESGSESEPIGEAQEADVEHLTVAQAKLIHGSLSWTACYRDDCLTHMGDKDGAGWYPKAPREKRRVFSAEEKWPCQENTPWQMCYKNTCEQHRNGKEEAGYWPQPVTKDEDGAREINTPCLQTGMKGES